MQSSRPLDLARVRHPLERVVFWSSVLVNAAIVGCAAWLIYKSPGWLRDHPAVSTLISSIRAAAIATIGVLPALGLLRRGRWAEYRERSVRLGRDQLPEIFSIFEPLCSAAGIDPPELYTSTSRSFGVSTSIALGRGRRLIVLGRDLFSGMKTLQDRADVLQFVLAHELGRLVLGHASWWEDGVLGYMKRIPLLRIPLLTVQTESRDRFAATLCPEAIRGLAFLASGGKLVYYADVATFVRQVMRDDTPPFWAWVGSLPSGEPHTAERIRHLYRNGFLDLDHDLARLSSGVDAGVPAATAAASR